MNFDFSDDQKAIQEQAQRMLADQCPLSAVRTVFEGGAPYDVALWRSFSDLGFLGVAIPKEHGGLGLGRDTLCLLALELGRVLAPLPVHSTLYLAVEALLAADDRGVGADYLPRVATGEAILTTAFLEGPRAQIDVEGVSARLVDGLLTGVKLPVADGMVAEAAVVTARVPDGGVGLFMVALDQPGVEREPIATIDPARPHARIRFTSAEARPLARDARAVIKVMLDRAAVYTAFEQLGGAEAALAMGCDYARLRHAFGRPIGSFQAIKHRLADMYVNIELARANCMYAAWALATEDDVLPLAAATARVSATEAFDYAARENIQVHGGIGATWEADMHLFYRRSRLLALNLDSSAEWRERVTSQLERRAA